MKWWFAFLVILFAGCSQPATTPKKLRVAAAYSDVHDSGSDDSMEIEEQNRHGEWMMITFYSLKNLGYNYKKTWFFIDSATRAIYSGSIPKWYGFLKQQTDSTIRGNKIYKSSPL